MKGLWGTVAFLITVGAHAQVVQNADEYKILNEEKGFITCTGGGTSSPLFSHECKSLTLKRVVTGGAIKYEGLCEDSNGTSFYLGSDAFNFEYSRRQVKDSEKKRNW
jgi:hypothetical protein